MKKILAVMLTLVMVISVLPSNVLANEANIVESLEVQDLEIIENSQGYFVGEGFHYEIYGSLIQATAVLDDGRRIESSGDMFNIDEAWYWLDIDLSIQDEELWTVGNTYPVTATLLGVSTTFYVSIVENPIAQIDIDEVFLLENFDGYKAEDMPFWYIIDTQMSGVTVTLKNGTELERGQFVGYTIGDQTAYLNVDLTSQDEEPWTAGHTYQVKAELFGFETTFDVTIIAPIQEVQLIKRPDKTQYVTGEFINFKGAIFRLHYEEGTYEDIAIDQDAYDCYSNYSLVYSEKLNRISRITKNQYGPLEDVGRYNLDVSIFGKTCQLPITVTENTISSISITEDENKSLLITANKTDNSSVDMKILWFDNYGDRYDAIVTDKGIFYGKVLDENGFAIGLYDSQGTLHESNALSESAWYTALMRNENIEPFIETYLLQNEYINFQYQGVLTSNNIDDVIRIASWYDYQLNSQSCIPSITRAEFEIDGNSIREIIMQYFAIEDVDLALSDSYNIETDTYILDMKFLGVDGLQFYSNEIKNDDGTWYISRACTPQMCDWKISTTMAMNEEYKIVNFEMKARANEEIPECEVHTYDNNSDDICNICAYERIFKSIAIKNLPYKTTYFVGESFENLGLSIVEVYSDGTQKTISTGYQVEGFDSSSAGEKELTVSYAGKTTSLRVTVQEESSINRFVTRLYEVCLNRTPDAAGKADWANRLGRGEISGIQAAYGFIFSNEFKGKNLCNEDYVEQLYNAFMGRGSDAGGKADWVGKLGSGWTREAVFNGFAFSAEFRQLCSDYGIRLGEGIGVPTYGTVPTGCCSVCGKEDGVTGFVKRLYSICLGREADAAGLADWTGKLWNHTASGSGTAYGFIFSNEFINKNHSNEDYVEYLYQAFMGRGSDAGGKADWVGKLNSGWSRYDVFNGFVGSQEFMGICNSYGIVR